MYTRGDISKLFKYIIIKYILQRYTFRKLNFHRIVVALIKKFDDTGISFQFESRVSKLPFFESRVQAKVRVSM